MIIDKISIAKFRGFKEVDFELGTHLTVIAGQNGTQKTTILGMLSQPFAITDDTDPMYNEKPLSGGSFKSAFSDKFKFSKNFDKAGQHEWTLIFSNGTDPYTAESIHRDKKKGTIRFWKKGDRSKGSGYIQLPVIYLSLKRLLPIGEDYQLKEDATITLDEDELKFYSEWHNKILILTREDDRIVQSSYLTSTSKQTLGANTKHYDWKLNSAGQDNLSKILLSILSFRRLKKKYPDNYKGGILAIDELDATMYTGSQIFLFDALIHFAADYNIQIIFTTHSLAILERASILQNNEKRVNQVKVMFLKKMDNNISIEKNINYEFIENHLNLTQVGRTKNKKIDFYTEDKEAWIFTKALLKSKSYKLRYIDVKLGCGQIIDLAVRKVPSFTFPNSILFLDGDVKKESRQLKRVNKIKNILLLPTDNSPEQILSNYLNFLLDSNELWSSIDGNYSHQMCFSKYSYDKIQTDREIAKKWFNSQLDIWGGNAIKVINPWIKENQEIVDIFVSEFVILYNEFAKKLGLDKL
jgi:hypothetical protein